MTPTQFLLILSLPITFLLILLVTPSSSPSRSYLVFICLINWLVTGCGWEVFWSLGLFNGLSYSERHNDPPVNDLASNVTNFLAVSSMDCCLQVLVFVASSVTIYGPKSALQPPTPSPPYLLALSFYGVLQNCLVTVLLPNTLEGVGRAPLAPFDVDFMTFAVVNGRALSVGNNIMWVSAPVIVLGMVARLFGGKEREGGEEREGLLLTSVVVK